MEGNTSPRGGTGRPGEVSLVDLNNALQNYLSQCTSNSNSVSTLNNSYSAPESEELRSKMNELIAALRR